MSEEDPVEEIEKSAEKAAKKPRTKARTKPTKKKVKKPSKKEPTPEAPVSPKKAVYKKIKKGQLDAIRIGRSYAIPKKYLTDITGKTLSKKDKEIINAAVLKTFEEYGELLKLLGRE